MPYVIGPAERTWLAGQAAGPWQTSMPWTTIAPQAQVISGVTCQVYRVASETNDHAKSKLSTLKDVIKRLQDAQLMFVDGEVHEFKVGLYDSGPSRGLVYFDGVNPLPTVVLQLGNRVSEHVMAGTTSANSATAGGHTATPPRIVADRVYDYYEPTTTSSEKDRCQIAQAMHEFGHVFHQLLSPAEYALNADVASQPAAADTTAMAARRALLPAIVTAGKAHVSQYAGVAGDAKTLNEFVAEVFSGLMMGVDWNTIDP